MQIPLLKNVTNYESYFNFTCINFNLMVANKAYVHVNTASNGTRHYYLHVVLFSRVACKCKPEILEIKL